ncbi:hypothetical protein GCM10027440_13530 [Nocardiopsis coralliicola]
MVAARGVSLGLIGNRLDPPAPGRPRAARGPGRDGRPSGRFVQNRAVCDSTERRGARPPPGVRGARPGACPRGAREPGGQRLDRFRPGAESLVAQGPAAGDPHHDGRCSSIERIQWYGSFALSRPPRNPQGTAT